MALKKKVKEPQPTGERVTDFIIFIGKNGTGKTTLAKKLISQIKNRRVLILQMAPLEKAWDEVPTIDLRNTEDIETFKGMRQIYYDDYERDTWELIFKNYHNGVLIMDDCRNYIDSQINIEPYLKKLFTNRRQKMMDMIAIVHAFDEIPPRFYPFYTTMYIFKSSVDPYQFRRNIPNFERVHKVWTRVNNISKQNPYYCEVVKP